MASAGLAVKVQDDMTGNCQIIKIAVRCETGHDSCVLRQLAASSRPAQYLARATGEVGRMLSGKKYLSLLFFSLNSQFK